MSVRRLVRRFVLWAVPELAVMLAERERQEKLARELNEVLLRPWLEDLLSKPVRPGTLGARMREVVEQQIQQRQQGPQ